MLFYAIHKQNFQDQYIGYIFNEIKKLIINENDINDRLSNENTELIVVEKYSKHQKDLQMMGIKDSVIIGLAQVLALIPGTSRSGITIIAGMSQKIKREEAARFSFLLSIPIVFGAGLKKLLDIDYSSDMNLLVLFLGGFSATITGYFVVKYLIKYLANHSLSIFAWYRFIIACLILVWFFLFGV